MMVQDAVSDLRSESRSAFESLLFPFLGSRFSDHATFEYLPIDISFHGVQIAIPKWVVNRELLKVGERIHLHLPFRYADRAYTEGTVQWARWDEDTQSQRYGIRMENPRDVFYPLYIHTDTQSIRLDLGDHDSMEALMTTILKDAVLLKKGILIYLNHLVPFFSRISDRSKDDYDRLKAVLFEDIQRQVKAHLDILDGLYRQVKEERKPVHGILETIDFNQLREAVCSEIQAEVLKTALDTDAVHVYIDAIQTLEKKIYTNYNALVIFFVYSLQQVEDNRR